MLNTEKGLFLWIMQSIQDTICLWEILDLMWPDNRKFGSSCLIPKDLPTGKLQFMTSVDAIQVLEGKKNKLLIYIGKSNLYIIKVRSSWAGKSLILHKDSTFQTYDTISVTKKGVTWAGYNFPTELLWEFSCLSACVCVCVRKRKGQAQRGRNLLHYALIWVYVGRVQVRIFSPGGPELGLNFMLRYLCGSAPNEFPVCTSAHCSNHSHVKNTAFTCML